MEEKEEILFSTDENRFRAALQDFLHRMNAKELEREIYERDSYPRALYKRLGEAGFLAQVLPPEYGGRGSLTCEAILTEELGAACVPLAWIHSTSSYVNIRATQQVEEMDVEELRRRIAEGTKGRPYRKLPLPLRLSERVRFVG